MAERFVKLVVFVPVSDADAVRTVLASSGAGKMGSYDSCSFSVRGYGRFRPLEGAHPHIGTPHKLEMVEEERIETICPEAIVQEVITAVRAVHPYEAPAIDIYPLA